jgi:hypothetical protein
MSATTATSASDGTGTGVGKPGDQAFAVAQQQLGKPYVYGSQGPNTFDCSGLMVYSYAQGPHLAIGRGTSAQWSNQTTLSTFFDAVTPLAGQPSLADLPNLLQVGDLVLYFTPGNDGENAHVRMYAGGGKMIEAPYMGQGVRIVNLDLKGSSREALRGVKRPTGGGSSGGAGGASGTGGGAGGGGNNSGQGASSYANTVYPGAKANLKAGVLPDLTKDDGKKAAEQIALQDLPDPRNNLPFSPNFAGKVVTGFPSDTGSPYAFMPNELLVRGGMMELLANTDTTGDPTKENLKQRTGGPFACYFMMNPQNISVDCSISADQVAPSQTDPTALQQGPYMVQNQSINFSLIFNRMYEVSMGGFKNPKDGSAGPSDIGCRWDIRSIERLMGIYDAQADFPGGNGKMTGMGKTGLGTYGAGDRPPQAMGLQVVFGGDNSYQFQGLISSFNYVYTLFSKDMIPIEATCDIGIMRLYTPNLSSGADIVNPLVNGPKSQENGQWGTIIAPGQPSGFNNPKAFRG